MVAGPVDDWQPVLRNCGRRSHTSGGLRAMVLSRRSLMPASIAGSCLLKPVPAFEYVDRNGAEGRSKVKMADPAGFEPLEPEQFSGS